MPEEDIKGPNLKEMSLKELESFVNSGGNIEDTETTTQDEDEPQGHDTNLDEETETDIETDIDENEIDEDPAEHQDDTPGQTADDNDIPEFYRGKTPKELIEIIENSKKFSSRQGNEIGALKTQLKSFQNNVEKKFDAITPTQADKREFLDDLQDETGYDKNELEIIQKIANKQVSEILKKNQETERQEKQQKQSAIGAENQNVWNLVRDLYPNSDEIEQKMVAEINKNSENTLYKKGWVQSFLKSQTNQTAPTNPQGTGGEQVRQAVKKRIVRTSTVKGSTPKKHVESIKREDLNSKDPETWRKAHNHFFPNAKLERI